MGAAISRYLPAVLSLLALPAQADVYAPIKDEGQFRSLVSARELRLGAFGISLIIQTDGRITGQAMGSAVTGTWAWRDGYFCREMFWNGIDIPYNCQLVEARSAEVMRFTTDKGTGQSAAFDLQ